MQSDFPFLVGRIALSDDWSLNLPHAVKQRFEDGQMVLWRPGFTMWITLWNNDHNQSAATRQAHFAANASTNKYDERVSEDAGRRYYSYRLVESADDGRVAALYGFVFSESGHLHISLYFDIESDAELAYAILYSANDTPPALSDPHILSQLCFATNLVVRDGQPVGYMYRESSDSPNDSGWRFFSGYESKEYVDNPANTQIYAVANVAQFDHCIIPYLQSEAGCQFEREGDNFNPIN